VNSDGTPTRGEVIAYMFVPGGAAFGSAIVLTLKLDTYASALNACYGNAGISLIGANSWQTLGMYLSLAFAWLAVAIFFLRLFRKRRTVFATGDQAMFRPYSPEHSHNKQFRYLLRRSRNSRPFAAVVLAALVSWAMLLGLGVWLAISMLDCNQCVDFLDRVGYCGKIDACGMLVGALSIVLTSDAQIKLFGNPRW
jgi:hypothetical protein